MIAEKISRLLPTSNSGKRKVEGDFSLTISFYDFDGEEF